jgi:hypothetical protein
MERKIEYNYEFKFQCINGFLENQQLITDVSNKSRIADLWTKQIFNSIGSYLFLFTELKKTLNIDSQKRKRNE